MVAPAGGKGTVDVATVTPVGKLPRVRVPFPGELTSDGCTVKEKLLLGNTVVGDGVVHKDITGAAVEG